MPSLKSLAKDTAIYGLSSIIGRFLNYLLVPLYTAKLTAVSGGYGIITNMYALTALVLVLLTFGMRPRSSASLTKKANSRSVSSPPSSSASAAPPYCSSSPCCCSSRR